MIVAVIDPGATTGLAVICDGKLVLHRAVDLKDPHGAIAQFRLCLSEEPAIIAIEDVHAVWGSAANATFAFGRNVGFWLGVVASMFRDPPVKVNIRQWQEWATRKVPRPEWKGQSKYEIKKLKATHREALKAESLRAAREAFPRANIESHDVADAVNMARFIYWKNTMAKAKAKTKKPASKPKKGKMAKSC